MQMLEEFSKGKVMHVKTQSEDERQFNFIAELSVLVDYEVIEKYFSLVQKTEDAELVLAVAAFFKRVLFQFKQPWIFYNLNVLAAIHDFVSK